MYKIHKKFGNYFIVEGDTTIAMCTRPFVAKRIKNALQINVEEAHHRLQQLQTKIRERVEMFAALGSWRQDSDAIDAFLEDLREL